ncbi:hypothetical protein [Persephonella sp.]
MKKISEYLNEISQREGYSYFYHDETREIWISGHNRGVRFDLLVRPIKRRYIKVIYETPDERKVILFLSEKDALNRLKKIFSSEETVETV